LSFFQTRQKCFSMRRGKYSLGLEGICEEACERKEAFCVCRQ
jgi:hypothetical protein